MLASEQPALPVAAVAIAVIRRAPEDADFAGILEPAQHAVVRNVTEQEKAPVSEPDRPFRPSGPGVQAFDRGVDDNILGESWVDDLNRRIGIGNGSLAILLREHQRPGR